MIEALESRRHLEAWPQGFLWRTLDLFHPSYNIYTDAAAAGNHFALFGRIRSGGDERAVGAVRVG